MISLLALALPLAPAIFQDPPTGEPIRVADELERRRLLLTTADRVPVEELVAQLDETAADRVWWAASVLVHHGLAAEAVAALAERPDPRLQRLALACSPETRLQQFLADESAAPEVRRTALFALQDRRGLTAAELAAALGDGQDELREAATVVALYETVPLSPVLLRHVEQRPRARRALLSGLARKRRPDAYGWLAGLSIRGGPDPAERLQVIAARDPRTLDPAMAREVLDAAGRRDPDLVDAAHRAAASLPARLADGLIAEVHRRCEQGEAVEQFLPLLASISPAGEQHLLAIASGMERRSRETVCAWLEGRNPSGLAERVRAALDGEIPLELHLLGRARQQLDRPERVGRVVERLRAGDEEEQLRAFEVLVRAGVYHPAMLAYALQDDPVTGTRARQLASLPAGSLPEPALLELLGSEPTAWVVEACRAAAKPPMSAGVEAGVLALAVGPRTEDVVRAATRAVMLAGREPAVRQVWRRLGENVDLRVGALDWLGRREDPWMAAFLREALAAEASGGGTAALRRRGGPVVDHLRLLLVRLGDRGQLDALIAGLHRNGAGFLRRGRSAVVPRLDASHVDRIAALARSATVDDPVRVELVGWLGRRPDLGVEQVLEDLAEDGSTAVRDEALRGLLAGPRRARLREGLLAELDRPLEGERRELAFLLVGSADAPIAEGDIELMARLVFEAPLAVPVESIRLDAGDRPPRAGLPVVRLVTQQLRRDPDGALEAVFGAVLDELGRRPDIGLGSRRLCLEFLRYAAFDRSLLDRVGPPVARLLRRIPEAEGAGPAHLMLAERAEARGDLARAAAHYRIAARELLRDPDPRDGLRVFLGGEDPPRGLDPRAALAARAPLLLAQAAFAAGRRDEALRELAVAAELAAGDLDSAREVLRLQTEMRR